MAMSRDAAYLQYLSEQNKTNASVDRDQAYQEYLQEQQNPVPNASLSKRDKLIQSTKMSSPLGIMSAGFKGLGQMIPSQGGILPSASDIGQRSQDFLFGGDSAYGTAGNIARTLPIGEAGALLRGAGALAKGAGVGGNLLSKVGEFLNPAAAKSVTSGIGKAALSGGISTAGLTAGENLAQGNPMQQDVLKNAALGVGAGGALQGVLGAVGKGANALISNRLNKIESQAQRESSGIHTPEEAQKILDAQKTLGTGDLPLSIGALTNQPNYNSYYEAGSKFPLAGQKEKMQEAVGATNQAANKVYAELFGNETPSLESIKKGVQDIHRANTEQATANYDDLFESAKSAGLNNIEMPNVTAAAKKALGDYNSAKAVGVESVLNKYPEVKSQLEYLSKPIGRIEYATGGKVNNLGLEELKQRRTDIGQLQEDLPYDAPKSVKNIVNNLYKQANKDIEHNIKKTGNPELLQKFNDTSDFYKNNIVPLRDESMSGVLHPTEKNEGMVNSLLKNEKVLNLLPPELRRQILGRKLIGAIEGVEREPGKTSMNINAAKLVKGYNNLDIKEKGMLNTILTPEEQNKLDSLQKLHDATSRYRAQIKAPENGAKLAPYLAKGGTALLAAGAAFHPGLAGMAAGGLGANRAVLDLMSHPDVLKAYANPALRKNVLQPKGIPQNLSGGINSMINYLISQ